MTLTNLLLFGIVCAANSLAIIGFNRACWYDADDKMILWRVKYWGDKVLGEFWSKPVYGCPTCMASLHGFIPFWLTYFSLTLFDPIAIVAWLFYTLTLSGLVTIIDK